MSIPTEIFPERLQQMMEVTQLNDYQLARRINEEDTYAIERSRKRISYWRKGIKVPDAFNFLAHLGQALECGVDYLLGLTRRRNTLEEVERLEKQASDLKLQLSHIQEEKKGRKARTGSFYAMRDIYLMKRTDRVAFEQFMTKQFLPTFKKLKGLQEVIFLKGYRGEWMQERKVDYSLIEIWENAQANRQIWMGDDGTFTIPEVLRPLFQEFDRYVRKTPAVDYVVISPSKRLRERIKKSRP
jgi:transcriptional regulator with XRE-family HTH domain